jgi:hypothetical protein
MRQERCTKVYIHVSMEDVCRKKYLSEHLRDGRLEGWYTGVFKCGSDGVMECWSNGVKEIRPAFYSC